MITLRQQEYFVVVSEHGSFRKAASALQVNESAVSRSIRDLEDRLGASLFQRHSAGVFLTMAGQRFVPHARKHFVKLNMVREILLLLVGPQMDGLVPSHAIDHANALDTAVYAAVDVVGPAIAGGIVAWLGSEIAMSMIALLYGCAAICLSRVPPLPGLASRQISFLRQTMEGIQIVVRQPTLRGLAISYSMYQVTWGVLYVVVPVFVGNHYDSEDWRWVLCSRGLCPGRSTSHF